MTLHETRAYTEGDVPSFLRSEGEMAQRIARFDWAAHPLGPIEAWPQSLKTSVSLILNSQHPMWIGWSRAMWFLYNDAYLHVLGAAKHEWALGRPAEEVWAEIWDFCGPLADKVFERGEASFVDDVQLFMDRGDILEETFYSFSYSPIRDEIGEVGGLFCPSNDITARVVGARRSRTLAELTANGFVERSTASAAEAAAATLAKNHDDIPFGLIYLVDGTACELQQAVGIRTDDELSPRIVDLSEPTVTPLTQTLSTVIETGRSARVAVPLVSEGPIGALQLPVLEAIVLPVAGRAEARPRGAIVAGLNPTCRFDNEYAAFFELIASTIGTAIQNARAAEDEKRRADMLAEMDRAKTVFFSSVSHEFRTPLTLMLGPLQQMERVEDPSQRALAATARRNALRLLKLVNTLLEFSRLEAGRNDASFAPTDLAALTVDVASSFRSAIEGSGLQFQVDAPLDEPAYVDRSMWERILLNLLSNALKFTFEGTISVALVRDGAWAELRVSDSGVGIPENELDRLFERFHRVRGTKSRSHEGSGIGLALVNDLVALHGGTVSAESTLGEGTTFRVRIPLGKEHLDPARVSETVDTQYASAIDQYLADIEATATRANIVPSTITGGTSRPQVLLADDNADLREYVSGILRDRYDVTTVSNGRQALDAARERQFDLIVSDVMMPEVDGFELLRALREDPALGATPFIMLSARAGEEAANEGLLAGADDYVTKPFSADELLARVYAQINAVKLRERVTAELRQSEERFRTLAASLPCVVFEADTRGAITFLSDEFNEYTGADTEDGLGQAWLSFVHPDDTKTALHVWEQSRATSEPFALDLRLRTASGYRWFALSALPQHDADGALLRWIGTFTDVHDRRQAARERDLLLHASEILARASTLDETLDALVRFTIPELADWSHIHLRGADGRLRTVAFAHRDPELDALGKRELLGSLHFSTEGEYGSPFVARTGKSQLFQHITSEMLARSMDNDDVLGMYQRFGARSSAIVPITVDNDTIGTFAVVFGDERVHTPDDLALLDELARRAGLAIAKARLYEREHRAAESFQEASLPAHLARVPGVTLDAFYSPGRDEAQVGGDWYDAMRLIDGRVVISIGDVAGSGLEAAVRMGNMRQIIRGIAQVHADPALMLDAADRALRLEHADTFVTAFVGVYDPIAATLTYASAGHPPPLMRRATGAVDVLQGHGLPLGLRSNDARGVSTTVAFEEGASLILYTDGLTEFERAPEETEARLISIVSNGSFLQDARPAHTLVRSVVGSGETRDDIAVLIAHTTAIEESDWLQRWQFDSRNPSAASAARHEFARAFADRGATDRDVATAELVFGELIGNTVRYAPGAVDVVADWSTPDPVLHVLDKGPGFRHISMLPPELLEESGRGLFIVNAITQEFRVARRREGGSHACAVLRREYRDLRGDAHSAYAGALLYSLTDTIDSRG